MFPALNKDKFTMHTEQLCQHLSFYIKHYFNQAFPGFLNGTNITLS